jgi:hypothetical protein
MTAISSAQDCCRHCPPPPCDSSNPSNAGTAMQGGKAVFENDNYRITCGDDNNVLIHNKCTGETYEAWGDPHMKIDGQQAFDFWGTTTLNLDDGTKVTIETTPFGSNPGMTLASKVTITNGDYGVRISGVDTNKTGDLKIDEAKGYGELLDAVTRDGNRLYENPCGQGFVGFDRCGNMRKVDQDFINETDLLKGGREPPRQPTREGREKPDCDPRLEQRAQQAFQALMSLVSISFMGGFLNGLLFGDASEARPRC